MNDLIRPALYGANHLILPYQKKSRREFKRHEFVGPICETTDKFMMTKSYQKLNKNDILLICDVGAYGMVLSSNYNLRPKAPEILVKGSKIREIRKRQSVVDII